MTTTWAPSRRNVAAIPARTSETCRIVGHESQVGAGLAWRRQRHLCDQGRILPQDRLFQRSQVGPRVEPELAPKHRLDLMQSPRRIGLPSGLVLSQRQQRPPALPERSLLDQRLSLGQYFAVMTGP